MKYLFLLLSLSSANAATFCVSQGGSGTGADWTSPLPNIPASQSAGSIYYLAGGNYSGFTVNGNGVVIKKAIPSDHGPSTGWNDAFSIAQAAFLLTHVTINAPNVTIDGQTGGGPGNWFTGFGIKISTALGTAACGPCIAVAGSSAGNNFTVRHCDLEGDHGDGGGCGNGNDCVQCNSASSGQNGITVSYCYMHDVGRCFIVTRGDGLVWEYTASYKLEYDVANEHSETLVCDSGHFDSTISQFWTTGHIIRNNLFLTVRGTGGLMFGADGVEIYGNIFYNAATNATYDYCNSGAVGVHDQSAVLGHIRIYHNTFIDATRSPGILQSCGSSAAQVIGDGFGTYGTVHPGNLAYNNLFTKDSNPNLGTFFGNGALHDYNAAINLTRGSISETHSVTKTVPALFNNETALDFTPVTNIVGVALDSTYTNRDMNGNIRFSHTVGALEFGGSVANTNPVPITQLTPSSRSF